MTDPREELRRFGAETRPRDAAVERVRERVGAEDPAELSRALLRELPEPDDAAGARVRRRLERPRTLPRRIPILVPAVLAAALLVALAVRAWVPREVRIDLGHDPSPTRVPGLALEARGAGTLGGDTRRPSIDWRAGRLSLEVDPAAGLDLAVRTDEATVRVLGTRFEVSRDALGTAVSVSRGVVSVTCRPAGAEQRLGAGERALCLPTTPAGLLARARTLEQGGGSEPEVLRALELGLSGPAAETRPAVAVELRLARAAALARAGRLAEAVRAYEELLGGGAGHREREARAGLEAARARAAEEDRSPPPRTP